MNPALPLLASLFFAPLTLLLLAPLTALSASRSAWKASVDTLAVPNLMFITQTWNQPPAMSREKDWKAKTTKEQYAISFEPLKRVQWAAVGSGGLGGLAEVPDIVTLANGYPNITGIYLDDFVTRPYTKRADGTKVGTASVDGAIRETARRVASTSKSVRTA